MEASLDLESLLMLPSGVVDFQPTSPVGSEGYTSETSSGTNCNWLDSPAASLPSVVAGGGGGRGSGCDLRGVESSSSPTSQSPMISLSNAMISQWSPAAAGTTQEVENRGSGSEYSPRWSVSPPSYHLDATTTGILANGGSGNSQTSSDVRIDVGKSVIATTNQLTEEFIIIHVINN